MIRDAPDTACCKYKNASSTKLRSSGYMARVAVDYIIHQRLICGTGTWTHDLVLDILVELEELVPHRRNVRLFEW